MPITPKNLDYLRNVSPEGFPEFGTKLVEALQSLASANNLIEQQVNGNSTGKPAAPPSINGLSVTAQNGHFQIAITDDSPIYSGIKYFVEHADNPNFTGGHVEDLGTSRNRNLFFGNVTRYFRAYSSYETSPPSALTYHGSSASPTAVVGGGTVGGPDFETAQGSGTGVAGQLHEGPGKNAFRAVNGAPPVRR